MPCSTTKPQPKPQGDELVIIPSETYFDRKEWQAIKDGASKGASQVERLKLKRVISTKFPAERHAKPGPKGSAPTDLARIQHQRFVWLLEEILENSACELTESEVLVKACNVVHNFNTFCEEGVFLKADDVRDLVRDLGLRSTSGLGDSERDFILGVSESLSASSRPNWLKFQESQAVAPANRDMRGFESVPPAVLIGEVLPVLLGIQFGEFRFLAQKRQRQSRAGRPKAKSGLELWAPGWRRDERIVLVPQKGSSENLGTAKLRPPPSEEEIFRKTVARLLLVKHMLKRRVAVELSAFCWDQILKYHQEEWMPELNETKSACAIFWNAAWLQPVLPWPEYHPSEALGRFIEIPEFGMLEADL